MLFFRWFLICIEVNAGPVLTGCHLQELVREQYYTMEGILPKRVQLSLEHKAIIDGRTS
jgi:hypothetical protein